MTYLVSSMSLPMKRFLQDRLLSKKAINKVKHLYEENQGKTLKQSQIEAIILAAYTYLLSAITNCKTNIKIGVKPLKIKGHISTLDWKTKDQMFKTMCIFTLADFCNGGEEKVKFYENSPLKGMTVCAYSCALMETRKSKWQILGRDQSEVIEGKMRNYMEKCYKHLADIFEQHEDEIYQISQKFIEKEVITLEFVEKLIGRLISIQQENESKNHETMFKVYFQWTLFTYYSIFSFFVLILILLKYFNIVYIPPLELQASTYSEIVFSWYPSIRNNFPRMLIGPYILNCVYHFFHYKWFVRYLLDNLSACCYSIKSMFGYIFKLRYLKTWIFRNRIIPSRFSFIQK